MKIIRFGEEHITLANKYQEKILSTKTVRRRSNYTTLQSDGRYFNTFLAQLCFREWLIEEKIDHTHLRRTDGYPLKHQFEMTSEVSGRKIFVNIMTSTSNNDSLWVMDTKLKKNDAHAYIASRMDVSKKACIFIGYATPKLILSGKLVRNQNTGVRSNVIPHSDLYKFESMFPRFTHEAKADIKNI